MANIHPSGHDDQPSEEAPMLLNGFNHVAILTGDRARFVEFYRDVL